MGSLAPLTNTECQRDTSKEDKLVEKVCKVVEQHTSKLSGTEFKKFASKVNEIENLPTSDLTGIHRITPPKTTMQEFVVPLSDGSKAVFQWPTALSADDVTDLQDSLKILERKILRSKAPDQQDSQS